MLYSAVDLFASEYGWAKDYIFDEIYPEEYFDLADQIKKRRINEYLIQIRVYHSNPKELVELLEREIREFSIEEVYDPSEIRKLKDAMSLGRGFTVK